MSEYRVAFDAATQVATILLPGHSSPAGSEEVGVINASAVGPNPTDASTQHVTTMLQRKGMTDLSRLTVQVSREPVTEVIEQTEGPSSEENGEELKTAVLPEHLDLAVGDSHDLVDGSTRGMKITSSDEEIVKVGRGGKVTALKAGTATVTVTNGSGLSNDVLIEAREPTSSTFAGIGAGSEAREAETA